MILLDTSQILIASITTEMKMKSCDPGMLRHLFFSKILFLKRKFPKYANRIVLAMDDRDYWRKDVFEFYKGTRKKMRAKSDLDWSAIYESINELTADLKALGIYKMVKVNRCEADDVIAIICKDSQTNNLRQMGLEEVQEDIMIISSDTDLAQLQKYKNVKQYSTQQKKFVTVADPKYFMMEHIMRGDVGDGVPNILSQDNCLMEGIRQKSMTEKFIQDILARDDPKTGMTVDQWRNFQRNEKLVNLDMIPAEYEAAILETYNDAPAKMDRMKLMMFMQKHKMKILSESLQDF